MGKSIYESLTGKKNPDWADKVYNAKGGSTLMSDIADKAKSVVGGMKKMGAQAMDAVEKSIPAKKQVLFDRTDTRKPATKDKDAMREYASGELKKERENVDKVTNSKTKVMDRKGYDVRKNR